MLRRRILCGSSTLIPTVSRRNRGPLMTDMQSKSPRFALRMCYKNWDAGYQELLDLSTMPTLENRRLYLKLCTLYKIIYGYSYFPPNVFTTQPSRAPLVSPLLNPYKLPSIQSSFVPSTISVWDNLPHTALTAHTIHSFKTDVTPFSC